MPKILVIETESSIREEIIKILETHAFQSLGAEDGLVGMKLAVEYQPDLIIFDIAIPNLIAIVTVSRQVPRFADTPFVFLRKSGASSQNPEYLDFALDDLISYPITQAEFLEAIAHRIFKKPSEKSSKEPNTEFNLLTTQDLITSLQTAEQKVNYLIQNDGLTGLLNRSAFNQKFNQHLSQLSNLSEELTDDWAILVIDLDRFNRINKNKGYDFADALLHQVAQRLQLLVGTEVNLARINADEFALIVSLNFLRQQQSTAEVLAQNILDSLAQSFVITGQEIRINASIGIAFYPEHGASLDMIMQKVNTALQRIKAAGGNDYCVYSAEIHEPEDCLELEIELYKAIARNQLVLHYQPQICLKTGKITGVEALLRWLHPQYGYVPWYKFIPLAERNGAIMEIGEWVIESACRQLKFWHGLQKELGKTELLTVSVNVSARQFQQTNLGETISNILAKTGLQASYLDLEITESTIVRDIEASILRLRYFKSLGLEISLDDFGTGYSSLSYLQQFPLDRLKIDQGFIRNMDTNSKNRAIAIALIQLGHHMNLQVLAEGVETRAELDILLEHGCDLIQGYLFSKALPATEFEVLLLQDRRVNI